MRLLAFAVTALLWTSSTGLSCDLRDLSSISTCIKVILEAARPAFRARYDPLVLKNASGNGSVQWWIGNVRLHGLSEYSVEHVSVAHTNSTVLRARFAVLWPTLAANASGKFTFCKNVWDDNHCFSLTCNPKIEVSRPSGSVQSLLNLVFQNESLSAFPSDTKLGVRAPKINVEVNLDGILGVLDKFLGFPSKKYATELVESWWKKKRRGIENELKKQLHKLIYKHLSSRLQNVLG